MSSRERSGVLRASSARAALPRLAHRRDPAAELVDPVQVARGDLDHRGDVRRVPPAVDVGLGEALAAAPQRGPDARVADDDGRLRRAGAEDAAEPVLDEGELAGLDALAAERRRGRGRTWNSRGLRSRMRVDRRALDLQGDRVGVDEREGAQRGARRRRRL